MRGGIHWLVHTSHSMAQGQCYLCYVFHVWYFIFRFHKSEIQSEASGRHDKHTWYPFSAFFFFCTEAKKAPRHMLSSKNGKVTKGDLFCNPVAHVLYRPGYPGHKSYPRNRLWRSIGLWDVKDPKLYWQSVHRRRQGCQSYAPALLYSQETLIALFLVLISVRGWVNLRA
jgi:hypothetical protein